MTANTRKCFPFAAFYGKNGVSADKKIVLLMSKCILGLIFPFQKFRQLLALFLREIV